MAFKQEVELFLVQVVMGMDELQMEQLILVHTAGEHQVQVFQERVITQTPAMFQVTPTLVPFVEHLHLPVFLGNALTT